MHALRRLQLAFAESVFSPADARIASRVHENGLDPVRRVRVYHNNMFVGLTAALEAVYPIVHRLVGTDFFRFAAKEYIRDHPSRSGNLHCFGDHFGEFLARLPSAAGLPYLPDVARLDWAYHEVFHAAPGARLDIEGLQDVPLANWGKLCFNLHPASRLLESSYPVLRIWQVNREDYEDDPSVDLAEGGVRVLVLRTRLEIAMYPLSPGEYAWLGALAEGRDITRSFERAYAVEPDFDLKACLERHVIRGTLVDWHLANHDELAYQELLPSSTRAQCAEGKSPARRARLPFKGVEGRI